MSNYTFDSYTKSADHDSDKWATTDRGWMYLDDVCYGHYLDYTGVKGWYGETRYPENYVHAVVFDRMEHSTWSSDYNRRWKVCESVQEAMDWMILEKTGQLALGITA